ncbi:MAG: homoserine O-acetyltransferase [Bacteroidetes bacterium GWE2_39_28]|nr:MAG: homoserine O-acetyltransferase [Bacteroidetes bacterium GWE2_39_28]OFY14521.1 MAG: homoserine O-acetyltransferase [Bacteroidetes bacterium GWF2_39_10]OFZ06906.1 MAG: homoserine O-acetyltransferase [Bacteroidetes bacterium RIFOXYB2_FULL_39_7]OFZ09525.1 MAG: homoserine O-acetyltransferase [Bacteroidetes bacterium RIFOXYC2_FULL_39_11]HCT93328.1 homoserine O-acetyltransferase [Rikenellaceae bacterium]
MQRKVYKHASPFVLESNATLDSVEICYHQSGTYSPGKRVIWICHALTANSNPQEWWSGLVGPGKLFDPEKYHVICANMLGSCYGSTGPASKGVNGKPHLLDFPDITVRDTVAAHNMLREHLGIEQIDLIIGGSIGGFQALEWSIMYPKVVKNLVLIGCNAAVSPWGAAFNESQRMALLADPSFREQKDINGGKAGLETARSIALLSYRSYEGYGKSQGEDNNNFTFASKACSYQRHQGEKLSKRFDAYSYYTLTKSVDSHNVARGRGSIERALLSVEASTLVIGIDTDNLFPLEEQIFLSRKIKGARLAIIKSLYGHDGFLLEWEQTESIIRNNFQLFNNN